MSLPSFLHIDKNTRHVSLDAGNPEFYRNPNLAYAALHETCPTFYWEEQGRWFFCGYDRVNSLLRDRRFGRQILHMATREDLGLEPPKDHLKDFDLAEKWSLLELEPPEHTRLRALVSRSFVSRQIEKLRPEIEALCHGLIDGFEKDGHVELLGAYAEIIPVYFITRMLGIPATMSQPLLDWSHAYVRLYMFNRTEADEHAANRAAAEFAAYVKTVIAEKRLKPDDDLITHMITSDRNGQFLTDDELVSTIIVLLNAGHEATVHQIGNSVNTIFAHGADPSMLFCNAAATERSIEECLRICAPVHIFSRYVLEDISFDGIDFKFGDTVSLILAAANLDPLKFPDPMRFKPDRDEGVNLSFGAGIHFCIGAPLARLEMHVALPILFARLPGLRLAAKPVVKDVYHFHGLEKLELEW